MIRRGNCARDGDVRDGDSEHDAACAGPGETVTSDDLEALLPHVYDQLHGLAERCFRGQRVDHTLQPTALVHEAYLRLQGAESRWRNRQHFYCVAARAMRQILINHARDKKRLRRGGDRQRVPLEGEALAAAPSAEHLEALEGALAALAKIDPRKTSVVELRYFLGLSIADTAKVLEVSPTSVKSDWALSRAWLLRYISEADRTRSST